MSNKNKRIVKRMIPICLFMFFFLISMLSYAQVINTILWEIKKKGVKNSYLLGTVHTTSSSFIETRPAIMKALHSASIVFVETVGKDLLNSNKGGEEKASIASYFSAQELQELDVFFEKNNLMPISEWDNIDADIGEVLAYLQFWYHNKNIPEEYKFRSHEMKMDPFLIHHAQKYNKKLVGLDDETIEEGGINFRNSVGLQDSISRGIMLSVGFIEGQNKALDNIYVYGLQEDLKFLIDYHNFTLNYEFFLDTPLVEENIHIRRNREWIKFLMPYLSKGGAFIGVGIKHLMYDEGLIIGLRKAGFKVTPVPLN